MAYPANSVRDAISAKHAASAAPAYKGFAVSDQVEFPIVGIGASAGGVGALEGFFLGLPDAPGLGFVIVTHLSPTRESFLHEIVARYTRLTVCIATDGQRVERDVVYVLPADGVLSIKDGHLKIQARDPVQTQRKPIDIFLASLAEDRRELSVGVILSGGDSDGTLGIKAIKERGGLTLAQVADGFGPENPDMPNSAIMTGLVDFAVPVEEMGQKLVDFARTALVLDDLAMTSSEDAEAERLEIAREEIWRMPLRTPPKVATTFAKFSF